MYAAAFIWFDYYLGACVKMARRRRYSSCWIAPNDVDLRLCLLEREKIVLLLLVVRVTTSCSCTFPSFLSCKIRWLSALFLFKNWQIVLAQTRFTMRAWCHLWCLLKLVISVRSWPIWSFSNNVTLFQFSLEWGRGKLLCGRGSDRRCHVHFTCH